MELQNYYGQHNERWTNALPLSGEMSNTKTCPNCKTPIMGVKRYGRVINKTVINGLDRRFAVSSSNNLKKLTGKIQEIKDLKFTETDGGLGLDFEALAQEEEKKCHTVANLAKNFSKEWKNPPRAKIFQQCKVIAERQLLQQGEEEVEQKIEQQLKHLGILKVDYRASCQALIYEGHVYMKLLQIIDQEMQYFTYLYRRRGGPGQRNGREIALVGIREKDSLLQQSFKNGMKIIDEAVKMAAECELLTCKMEARISKARLQLQLVLSLQFARNPALSGNKEILAKIPDVKKYQLEILNDVHVLYERMKVQINHMLERQMNVDVWVNYLQLLKQDYKNTRKQVEDFGKLSEQERIMIVNALAGADYLMRDATGYRGTGRWFECPNGHPYVIGECGGAMQESRCPECGETIGGTRHTLRSSNVASRDFAQAMQHIRR
eukprot:TRINITY_DN6404_c0_g1_i1.p2 TRINITY_DN6404_c0_g1~~TRINITY_DN6404_c0_g1_i1.p2  ORF type:complete len:435 (+),score=44.89 TRINITY_DN6404_c0_g1_i1:418-1722(+)